jgi:hydrogenase-1 operon protein HyaF
MRPVTIPIRSLMADAAEGLVVMPMPHDMATFEMPRVPEPGPGSDVAGARDVLQTFLGHLDAWLGAGAVRAGTDADAAQPAAAPPALDLAGLVPDTLRVLNETLGEGEVAAIVRGATDIRIQETVFPGVWRERHFGSAGELLHDYLLAAPIPPVVEESAAQAAQGRLRALELPEGAMNVPALLHELQDAIDRCGGRSAAHVINLTLLPMAPADTAHLDRVLDGGAVTILSRGFGNCRIGSTAARNVWRVQYFNNMQTLILNTLEVVAIPEAALAATEDLADTRERLADLVRWMSESLDA